MITGKKKNVFFFTTSIIALLSTLYVLYITIYEQLINQSSGYFYAGVFGFILLLVFLLCNLFTKLIAISNKSSEAGIWRYIIIASLFILMLIYVFARIGVVSQLAAEESRIYKSALTMIDGTYSQNRDLVDYCLNNSSAYLFACILSVVFRVTGASSLSYILINAVIYALCLLFVYRITCRFSDRFCAIFSVILSMVFPIHSFVVFEYDSSAVFSLIFLIGIDIYTLLFVNLNGRNNSRYFSKTPEYDDEEEAVNVRWKSICCIVLAGLITGIMLFMEPVMLIPVIFLIIASFILKKKHSLGILIAFAAGFVLFIILTFAKSINSDEDFGNVIASQAQAFDFFYDYNTDSDITADVVFSNFNKELGVQDNCITDTYFFLYDSNGQAAYTEMSASWKKVENQVMYMFLLVMTISCIIIAMKENMINISILNILIFGQVLLVLFEQNRDVNKNSFIQLLLIFTGVSIHYLYLNHHPEQLVRLSALDAIENTGRQINGNKASNVEEQLSEEEFLLRSQALIFVDSDERLYRRIKQEERSRALRDTNNVRAIEDTFDDYDEDFFFDESEVERNTEADQRFEDAISMAQGNYQEIPVRSHNTNNGLPAWKQKPERFGDDDRFFDEEDEEDVVTPSRNIKTVKVSQAVAKPIDNTSDRTLDRKKVKPDKKQEKEQPNKESKHKAKISTKTSIKTDDNSINVVRRVKTVGLNNDALAQEYMENHKKAAKGKNSKNTLNNANKYELTENTEIQSSKTNPKYIDNPLPVPKKKKHKPMDYDKKITNKKSGWDYDYDVDDDDDWDV